MNKLESNIARSEFLHARIRANCQRGQAICIALMVLVGIWTATAVLLLMTAAK